MTLESDYSTLYNNELQEETSQQQQQEDDDDSFTKLTTPILYDNDKNNHYKMKQLDLYKTEYCRNWAELGTCRYGTKCRYAHGEMELRMIPRHNRYKTQVCKAYHLDGTCSYGNRCTYIHDDIDLPITDLIKNEGNNNNNSNKNENENSNEDELLLLLSSTATVFPTPTMTTLPPPLPLPPSTTSLLLSSLSSRKESRFFIKDENNMIKSKVLEPSIMNEYKLWNSKLGLTLHHDYSSSSLLFPPFLPFMNDENRNHRHSSFSSTTTNTTTSTSLSSSSSLCYFNDYSFISPSFSSSLPPPPSSSTSSYFYQY